MEKGWRRLHYPVVYLNIGTVCLLCLFFYQGEIRFSALLGIFFINGMMTILHLRSHKKEFVVRRILGMAYLEVVYTYQGIHGLSLFFSYLVFTLVLHHFSPISILSALLLFQCLGLLFVVNTIWVAILVRRLI